MLGGSPPEDMKRYTMHLFHNTMFGKALLHKPVLTSATLETALAKADMPTKGTQTSLQKYFSEEFVIQTIKVHTTVLQDGDGPTFSPTPQKELVGIRKMSEMSRTTSNSSTIPTQESEISTEWAMLIVNQLWLKQQLPALSSNSLVSSLQLEDYKNSNGDMSTTVRVAVDLEAPGKSLSYYFIAKLLPNDGPCGVYCFKANIFKKEISNYFEMLPTLQQTCQGQESLEQLLSRAIPQCVYGSNNMDGTRVLVFEYAL